MGSFRSELDFSQLRSRQFRADRSVWGRYFAAEIIGNILGLEPRKWRKPRRIDTALNKERAGAFGERFQPFDWTVQLQEAQ